MKVNWELDFYSTLGLSPGTDQESLRKAYLQLAMKYHPDRNPGDRVAEEKFKLISQAYAVLRDPAARSRYDRMRRSSKARAAKTARSSAKKYKPSSFESQNSYRAGPGHNQKYNQNQGQADLNGRTGTFAKTGPGSANRGTSNPSSGQSHFENPKSAARSAETFSTGNRQKGTSFQGKNREEPSDSDIMADLFKTKEGRRSLNQVDEELKKAGLGHGLGKVMNQFQETFLHPKLVDSFKDKAGKFLKSLKSKIFTNPLASKDKVAPEDIIFGLVLTPEAAATGTTIDINYLRDNLNHHLSVKIPAGLNKNARLRLSGQGHLNRSGRRGDLLLDLSIKKPGF